MKLAINLALSLFVLALSLWLVWPNAHDRAALETFFRTFDLVAFLPTLVGTLALFAVLHFFRAWRWNNLLRPMGVSLAPAKLLAISSVGFMAILALPARLGEFVRPALLRQKGKISASAVLGTVAVERIVDGLVVSFLVFGCCLAIHLGHPANEPAWMMPMAYASLAIFCAAMTFLAFALRWPRLTTRVAVKLTLLPRFAPRLATKLEEKLHELIRGFLVLKDARNLAMFVVWSLVYWGANGLSMWVLARGMGLELSVIGAFATMGIIAVGIMIPNSPGLVGLFHGLTILGLSLYVGEEVARTTGLAYAIVLHGLQVIWYVGLGVLSMFSSHVTFNEVWASRRVVGDETPALAASKEPA